MPRRNLRLLRRAVGAVTTEDTYDIFEVPGGGPMLRVHPKGACGGRWCVIHKPMNTYDRTRLHWRDDRGIFEVFCEHSVGHPAPEQLDYWREQDMGYMDVHGCDGCCAAWTKEED